MSNRSTDVRSMATRLKRAVAVMGSDGDTSKALIEQVLLDMEQLQAEIGHLIKRREYWLQTAIRLMRSNDTISRALYVCRERENMQRNKPKKGAVT